MADLSYIIFISFAAISLYWYYRLCVSASWLRKNRSAGDVNRSGRIYIIIPVLDEVKRIGKTVSYFLDTFGGLSGLTMVLVSTEREYDVIDHKTKIFAETIDKNDPDRDRKLADFADSIDTVKAIAKISDSRIMRYHYARRNGKMAHQLNHAIRAIIKENPEEDAIFAVYNADSRPHPETVGWVMGERARSGASIFQQYGNYCKNIDNFRGWAGYVLTAAALWQTRWSLGFEIYNALKQLKYAGRKKSLFYPLNYCIGHGLFFTKEIYEELGGFSEDTYNEDAIWGLKASFKGRLIMPVPYFDASDTPDTVKSLFYQKTGWFFGPFEAFGYYRKIKAEWSLVGPDKLRLLFLSAKLFSHAVFWIAGPSCFLLSLILAILSGQTALWLLFFAEIILFLSVPNIFVWLIMGQKRKKTDNLVIGFSLGMLVCYFMHGASAYRSVIKSIFYGVRGRIMEKGKTEML
ncbi:MAG: glycosyltransferase family 2 protein [Candidatus Falkowbacteria bacterium]